MIDVRPLNDALRLRLRDVQRSADRLLLDVMEARLEASLPGEMGDSAARAELGRWALHLMAIVAFIEVQFGRGRAQE